MFHFPELGLDAVPPVIRTPEALALDERAVLGAHLGKRPA